MMIGIGTDFVSKKRIEALWLKYELHFAKKILNAFEIELLSKNRDPIGFLSKRFAAKEAVSKALGTGIGEYVKFHDITIQNKPSGQPYVEFRGVALETANKLGVKNIHISLTDEKNYALAFVILNA